MLPQSFNAAALTFMQASVNHTAVTNTPLYQLLLSKQEQGITTAHPPHHLQQFTTAHKSALHSRTPINTHHLHQELISHPDQLFVIQLIHNLEHGCAIGYSGPQFSHYYNNLLSAFQQPSVPDNALAFECSAGHLLRPFQSPPLPNLHCSGLGIISKHNGGWCTVYHISAPGGFSINDCIRRSRAKLTLLLLCRCCLCYSQHLRKRSTNGQN